MFILGEFPNSLHMRTSEQEIVRIYIASFDKCLRLFCAAAWICLVHQPAFVLHETVKVTPGSRKLLAEVFPRDFQQVRAGGISDAKDLA